MPKSKKSQLSQSSSSSLAESSATGSFTVVSRRGHNNPSSSTLSLPSATQESDQPKRTPDKEKEKEKTMTKLSGLFSSSKKGKEKTPVQSMEPKTGVVVLETMPSLPTLTTVSKSSSPSSESSRQGPSRPATVRGVELTAAEHPRPLFVANPDPSPEVLSGESLSFSASESSSSSTSGYTSQTSYTESGLSLMKSEEEKEKDSPSTATQPILTASNDALLNLFYPEEEPPAYTPLPQAQPQKHATSSSDPHSVNSNSPSESITASAARPRPNKPAPLRHISVPALPTQDRPQLPSRAVSVPDAEFVTQDGGAMGHGLDRIDELDESNPYGVNLHICGPFDAARTAVNGVSSSKPSHLQPGFFDRVTTIPYNPFGIPKGGLQVGQVIPRNPTSSQTQHIRHQRHPSYTNHHLQPGGTNQNRTSSLSFMSAPPSPGWPLPSPGFPDSEPEVHCLATPVAGEKSLPQSLSLLASSPQPVPGHMTEASSSPTVSSFNTAPHDKPSNQRNAYRPPSPSNDTFLSNSQTARTPSSANWSTTVYSGIEDVHRANVRQSQIGLALGSPLPKSPMNVPGLVRTPVGGMIYVAEEEEGKGGGAEGIGMAILREGSSDDEEAQSAAVPTQLKTAAADEIVLSKMDKLLKSSEIRDEDYEYWTGASGSDANEPHKQPITQITWDSGKGVWTQPGGNEEFQNYSPYSLLDDKDAVERFEGPPVNSVDSSQRQAHRPNKRNITFPSRGHDREASIRTMDGTVVDTTTRNPPHLRPHTNGPPPPPQQRSQTVYMPNFYNPPTVSIPPHSRSLQSSPTPYLSNPHNLDRTPVSTHPYPVQAHLQDSSQFVTASPKKHYSLPSSASPDWVQREASYGPITTAPQNSPYHPHQHTNGVNGRLNSHTDRQRDPTSLSLPPGATAPNPNYQRQTPPPPINRFTPPNQNPHLNGNSDMPPGLLNRPRHAPTKLVMPAPLQGQGPPPRPRSPYHSNGPPPAQKYPPPPPIPPLPNGSAGKVLRKQPSMTNTTSGSTRTNGGDGRGYMSSSGRYVSEEGVVGRSKTMQAKKAPKRVLSKRRADL